MDKKVSKKNGIIGQIVIPADKSISHRAIMFSALANGKSVIKNFSKAQDPCSTLNICKDLGVEYNFDDNDLSVISGGILKSPIKLLDCGNSGTTMRLMLGILAGQSFESILSGDESLSKRPMKRVITPLAMMGAQIVSNDNKAPLKIRGTHLTGIEYRTPIPSAQVKSAILLAGLFAEGKTVVLEDYQSRNHTELMLEYMEADIEVFQTKTVVEKSVLCPKVIEIPGDISSAAYFIAAAILLEKSELILKNVGLNSTRTGILEVLKTMGADIEILDKKLVSNELVGDLRIRHSDLKGVEICGELIPKLIDEIPIIAVLATQTTGSTIIKDAQDLRNKESDRIHALVIELKKLGANIEETYDGMIIHGKTKLKGGVEVDSYKDHRLAMSLYVAGLICQKEILIKDFDWVDISFPEFEKLITENLV